MRFLLEITVKNSERGIVMKVICSWCRGEGRDGLVGEKAPLDDQRETHSICGEHEQAVRACWSRHRGNVRRSTTSTNGVRVVAYRTRRIVLSAMQLCVGLGGLASKARL